MQVLRRLNVGLAPLAASVVTTQAASVENEFPKATEQQ